MSLFNEISQADVIERLRLQYKKDLLKVVDIVLSHQVSNLKHCLVILSFVLFFSYCKILYSYCTSFLACRVSRVKIN